MLGILFSAFITGNAAIRYYLLNVPDELEKGGNLYRYCSIKASIWIKNGSAALTMRIRPKSSRFWRAKEPSLLGAADHILSIGREAS